MSNEHTIGRIACRQARISEFEPSPSPSPEASIDEGDGDGDDADDDEDDASSFGDDDLSVTCPLSFVTK